MKKGKSKGVRSQRIFVALYCVGFLGAWIIGFFGNSFFAHDIFHSLWAFILYLFFISLLYITAFVQETIKSRKKADIIVNTAVFLGGLAAFLLQYCLGGIFTLISVLYSAVMMSVIVLRVALVARRGWEAEPNSKQLIAAFALLLWGLVSLLTVEFVDDWYVVWSLIPTAILSVVIIIVAVLLYRNTGIFAALSKWKRIGYVAALIFCSLVGSFMYSFTAVGVANCVLDFQEPVPTECIVLEKKIRSGARQVTEFEVKVLLDNRERWFNVSTEEYYSLSEGDTVTIDYYTGAFHFAYFAYGGKNRTNAQKNKY